MLIKRCEIFSGKFQMEIQGATQSVNELRSLLVRVREEKANGTFSAESARNVRKSLIKLRRAHSALRGHQQAERKKLMDVAKQLQETRSLVENSQFLESQCQFLVERFNSAQCPELEKISSTVPTIEQYTAKHEGDAGFVSYKADPHQFMLNLLSSELEERHALAEQVVGLRAEESRVRADIVKKQKFIASLMSSLSDLSKSVDSVVNLFSPLEAEPRSKSIEGAGALVSYPDLFVLANKFNALLDRGVSVSVKGSNGVSIIVSPASSTNLPTATDGSVSISFRAITGGSGVHVESVSDKLAISDIDWSTCEAFSTIELIRLRRVVNLWNEFEISSLTTNPAQTLPLVTSAVLGNGSQLSWLADGETVEASLTKFARMGKGCKVNVATLKDSTILRIDLDAYRVKVIRGSFVSSIDSNDDPSVAVDMRLAQVEVLVNKWFKSKISEFASTPVPGILSGVLVRTVQLVNQL